MNALLRKIADAEYAPGDPIPTVVELARDHAVDVSAVQEARERLIADGVLVLRPGVGTIVAPPAVNDCDCTEEELSTVRRQLDRDIDFLREALESPDTSVRWDPDASDREM